MDLQIRPTEASLHLLEFLFQIAFLDKLVDVGRIDAHRIAAIVVIKVVVVGGTKKLNERIVINNHLLQSINRIIHYVFIVFLWTDGKKRGIGRHFVMKIIASIQRHGK